MEKQTNTQKAHQKEKKGLKQGQRGRVPFFHDDRDQGRQNAIFAEKSRELRGQLRRQGPLLGKKKPCLVRGKDKGFTRWQHLN